MRAQEFPEQGRRGRLAVRPRNGIDGRRRDLARKLHLCRDADAALSRSADERDALRHGGRKDDEIRTVQKFFPLCTKDAGDSLRP